MDGAAATSAYNDADKYDATSVPNAAFKAANNDVMEVDATSNDAKEEGEDVASCSIANDASAAASDTDAAVNNYTMNVDAPSNDANEEEGEDTNGEENISFDAHNDTPTYDSGELPDELWNLKKIYTRKDILKSNAVKCMGDKCRLVACSIWSSNLNPEEPWFYCLGKLLCTIMCCIRFLHKIRDDISSTLPHAHSFFPNGHGFSATKSEYHVGSGCEKDKEKH